MQPLTPPARKSNKIIEQGLDYAIIIENNPFLEQGSHNGLLHFTISSKPRSIFRRISWLVQKFYKYYFRRLFTEHDII